MRVKWDMKGKLGVAMTLGVINSGIPFCHVQSRGPRYCRWIFGNFQCDDALDGRRDRRAVLPRQTEFSEKLQESLFGLAGVAVLTRTGPAEMSGDVLLGAAACLVATACYGLASFPDQAMDFRQRRAG